MFRNSLFMYLFLSISDFQWSFILACFIEINRNKYVELVIIFFKYLANYLIQTHNGDQIEERGRWRCYQTNPCNIKRWDSCNASINCHTISNNRENCDYDDRYLVSRNNSQLNISSYYYHFAGLITENVYFFSTYH